MANWDEIYQTKSIENASASSVLLENKRFLPVHGKALDFACGLAGNGVFMASLGLQVTAWDLSEVAVNKINAFAKDHNLSVHAEKKDLENDVEQLSGEFDVIVVSFFLCRSALSKIYNLLAPGGVLFYQTFSGEQLNGVGPARADFRLKRGELLMAFPKMALLFYREDSCLYAGADGIADQVFFVAQK
jgi:SAM-dependent methyltransferase